MGADNEEEADRSIGAYFRLLRDYPGWRILWIGEVLSNTGNWFNYVATLLVVEKLANGRGILLSIVLVIHFLPSFILFPIAGVIADRYDRVKVIIYSGLVSAVAVLLLPIIQHPSQLWLMYILLIISFSTTAFYDPARRALAPSLVPRNMLHLATTLDSFAWSLTGAFGSSLGGLAASTIGTQACFYLDAVTYLVAALCAYKLKTMLASGEVTNRGRSAADSSSPHHLPQAVPLKIEAEFPDHNASASPAEREGVQHKQGNRPGNAVSEGEDDADEESSALLRDQKGTVPSCNTETPPEGCLPLLWWGLRDEVGALKEGWQYAVDKSNRDVLGYTLLKASGTILWGAGDILNVRFSELPEMQGFGDAAFTLGLFFASIGLACFLGPVTFNIFTPPKPPNLMLSSAICFVFLFTGYAGLVISHNAIAFCLSTMVRSFGSSVLWIYSTLLLQLRVPDELLGRMLALEVAFFTIGESASVLMAGYSLDNMGITIRQLCLVIAVLGVIMTFVWLPFTILRFRQSRKDVVDSSIEL